jgi:hypothetical protein
MTAAAPLRPAKHPAQSALIRELGRVALLHDERRANARLAGALEHAARWQSLRLGQTYADLDARPRYADAIRFFQTDLYGSADFARRDADLARVVPILVRTLPERVIATIAQAVELNVLSQELDRALLARLPRAGGGFTVAEYCRAYRLMNNRPGREHQIHLIIDIGTALDRYVRLPLLRTALVLMRQPAKLAGMLVLHDFLERGFTAFRRMNGASEFLATILARETALMNAIFDGDDAPFAEPLSAAQS